MKRIALIVVLAVLLVPALGACQQTTLPDAKTDFCNKLDAYGEALDEFNQLTPDSTVDEMKTAKADVESAWTELQDAASTLTDVQLDEAQSAMDGLMQTVNDIPDDATLSSALTTVVSEVKTTREAIDKISTTVCVDLPEPQE